MCAPESDDDPWAGASWEGAEAATLAVGARMTLAERLRWLEQAARSARTIAGARASSPSEAEPALTLLALLARLGGAELEERWADATVAAGLLRLGGGRRLLVVERTYREGIRVLLDPTESELAAARNGRLWDLWNSDRAELLAGAI
jgi:hypothetical protein